MIRSADILVDQTIGSIVQKNIADQTTEQAERLAQLTNEKEALVNSANESFQRANTYIEKCRDFVSPGNRPHILGNESTKHGEIAETLDVNFKNGRDALNGLKESARVLSEGQERTGPTDYVINGTPIQSKFINGGEMSSPDKSLTHILNHLKKYPGYANDTTQYGFPGHHGEYQIPKDQYEVLQKVLNGGTTGMSERQLKATKELITEIEKETGKPVTDVVKPSLVNYDEVKLCSVDETIDREEESYSKVHEEKLKEISKENKEKVDEAKTITDASWAEAFKAAGIGAAISGTVRLGISVYSKIKGGKKLSNFEAEDWKECGVDFSKGAIKGGLSGFAIYGLTKLGSIPAPFAGAITSSAAGLFSLFVDYKKGLINSNEYAEAAESLCVETGAAAVGAAVGQALIPVPVIGAVVGSITTQSAIYLTKYLFENRENELLDALVERYNAQRAEMDATASKKIKEIESYYQNLGGLIEASMNKDLNKKLLSSVKTCQTVGVPEIEIMHDTNEVDTYMRN